MRKCVVSTRFGSRSVESRARRLARAARPGGAGSGPRGGLQYPGRGGQRRIARIAADGGPQVQQGQRCPPRGPASKRRRQPGRRGQRIRQVEPGGGGIELTPSDRAAEELRGRRTDASAARGWAAGSGAASAARVNSSGGSRSPASMQARRRFLRETDRADTEPPQRCARDAPFEDTGRHRPDLPSNELVGPTPRARSPVPDRGASAARHPAC